MFNASFIIDSVFVNMSCILIRVTFLTMFCVSFIKGPAPLKRQVKNWEFN